MPLDVFVSGLYDSIIEEQNNSVFDNITKYPEIQVKEVIKSIVLGTDNIKELFEVLILVDNRLDKVDKNIKTVSNGALALYNFVIKMGFTPRKDI